MGSIPPLSLGPPVVRPLRTTVVRPLGNLTLTVLAVAAAGASINVKANSVAASLLIGVPFVRSNVSGRARARGRVGSRGPGRRRMITRTPDGAAARAGLL